MATFELLASGYSSLNSCWWYFVGRDADLAFWVNRDGEADTGHPSAYSVRRFVPGQDAEDWVEVAGPEADEIVAFCHAAPQRYDIRPDKVKARELYWAFKAGKLAGV
jgi:hypothetical protein